jgi:hypothetical protein
VPDDEDRNEGDEGELELKRPVPPEVKVRRHCAAARQQHGDRRKRSVAEATRDGAEPVAIGGGALDGDDGDGEQELATDEERHGEHVQPAHRLPAVIHPLLRLPPGRQPAR